MKIDALTLALARASAFADLASVTSGKEAKRGAERNRKESMKATTLARLVNSSSLLTSPLNVRNGWMGLIELWFFFSHGTCHARYHERAIASGARKFQVQ